MRQQLLITVVYLFWMSLLLSACGPGADDRYEERIMPVTAIDSTVASADRTSLYLQVEIPNLCWKFSRYEVERKGPDIYCRVYAKMEKDALCAQMISSFSCKVDLDLAGSGEYTFRAWRGDQRETRTTIRR